MSTKVGYLGAGTWGVALASILAKNGCTVIAWTRDAAFAKKLQKTRVHPKLPKCPLPDTIEFTSDMKKALKGADLIVESVTSAGILLPEVVAEVIGNKHVGCLSGPSHAEEVIQGLPTSVVCSGYEDPIIRWIQELFTTPTFRVYPNGDLAGVSFGGAMKNIMAIACGISDGLGCGDNAKAVLMTRGLHEVRKLAVVKGCNPETLTGLSGMGDLCVTCLSTHSRNYRFGRLLAEGHSAEAAREKIGMAVEGVYTCLSAYELGQKHGIPVPITEATYSILYGGLSPKEAVRLLLQRAVKEEHL